MQSAEMDKLIQIITDRLMEQLEQSTQASIIFCDNHEAYPATYVQKLSADYHLVFGSKQDSDAILLCLSQITLPQLIAVANLTAVDELSSQVIQFILAGKPVWVFAAVPNLTKYRQQTRFAVWQQIKQVLQKLTAFDIQFIQSDDQFEQALAAMKRRLPAKVAKRQYVTKTLLQKRWQRREALLKTDEVLTDLAAEWAQDKNLKL